MIPRDATKKKQLPNPIHIHGAQKHHTWVNISYRGISPSAIFYPGISLDTGVWMNCSLDMKIPLSDALSNSWAVIPCVKPKQMNSRLLVPSTPLQAWLHTKYITVASAVQKQKKERKKKEREEKMEEKTRSDFSAIRRLIVSLSTGILNLATSTLPGNPIQPGIPSQLALISPGILHLATNHPIPLASCKHPSRLDLGNPAIIHDITVHRISKNKKPQVHCW
jgi:hypothetical protein